MVISTARSYLIGATALLMLTGCITPPPTLQAYSEENYFSPTTMQVVVDCSVINVMPPKRRFDFEFNEQLCNSVAKEAQAFLLTSGPSSVVDVEVSEVSLGASLPRDTIVQSAFSGIHLDRSSPSEYSLPVVNRRPSSIADSAFPGLGHRISSILKKDPNYYGGLAQYGCCASEQTVEKLVRLKTSRVGSNVDDDKHTLYVSVAGTVNFTELKDKNALRPGRYINSTFIPNLRTGTAQQKYWSAFASPGYVAISSPTGILATAVVVTPTGEVLWAGIGGHNELWRGDHFIPDRLACSFRTHWDRTTFGC